MSHDQCPSTLHGEKKKPGKAELAMLAGGAPKPAAGVFAGQRLWRSLDEQAGTPEFRDWMEREFPAGASELARSEASGAETRRDFLKFMGASVALAGVGAVAGCRRPDHKILTYSREVPEEIVPGKPLFYATSMPRPDGGAEGLLVETHEGRPTKIEGNPLHPINRGKSSVWALSSVLSLYDPDRLKNPRYDNPGRGVVDASWDDFRTWGADHFKKYVGNDGAGLAFVYGKVSSMSLAGARAALAKKYPKAMMVPWASAEARGATEGSIAAFGAPMREVLDISKEKTRVIVSLDRDFLHLDRDELTNARGFARSRDVVNKTDTMSRLYVIESGFSLTGGSADHRLSLSPTRVSAFAVELAKLVLAGAQPQNVAPLATAIAGVKGAEGADIDRKFLQECARDLLNSEWRGKTLVVAGATQPASVHALCIALNAALGNFGNSVSYTPMSQEEATNSLVALAALTKAIEAGTISTLVCMNANPVYDAPGDLGFGAAFAKVPARITLSVEQSETALASTWSLNGTHFLESWGDTIAGDGTIAPVQPMIAPLYEPAMSELELTTLLAGGDMSATPDGYAFTRAMWSAKVGAANLEKAWRRALHDGVLANTGVAPVAPACRYGEVAKLVAGFTPSAAPTQDALDVSFRVGRMFDGRMANIAWLQELPECGTMTVWDNPALMSPATAEALGLAPVGFSKKDLNAIYYKPKYPEGEVAEFTLDGRKVRAAVWILPGMADNTVVMTLGYGRSSAGRVGDGVGFDVNPLRSSASGAWAAPGVKAAPVGERHMIVSTQNHWSMEGRTSIVRAVDLPMWNRFADEIQDAVDTFYRNEDRVAKLNFAESLGELSHTPPNLSIYENPLNRSVADPDPKNIDPGDPNGPRYQQNTPPRFLVGPQWGMTIDQTSCTGCGVCTIACQSENNIPVVGKKEVAKGRELAWIRVDRYFAGGDAAHPEFMFHQPVACVHCENAPCEVVCPVNATVHGPEGLNYMVYNRCIGTRYCANNCPYKVRRFNFFDYGVTKFNGQYMGQEALDGVLPDRGGITGSGEHNKINPNLIPPRLRAKLDEISRMQKNPDVTIRSRGVMEKCTYCIQRINQAKIETKLAGIGADMGVPDGFFQTACQQACPSDSIVFGDILDVKSRVHATRAHARSYGLLNYLNTRPRTSHMVRVLNPNPSLCDEDRKHMWEVWPPHGGLGGIKKHGGGEHGGDHGGDHGGSHGGLGGGHDDHGHDKPASGGHSFNYIPGKKVEDRGYSLSLTVLGGGKA
jgi:molybdopterin-containing oxidoreductase family iron-sulfur binding subunit